MLRWIALTALTVVVLCIGVSPAADEPTDTSRLVEELVISDRYVVATRRKPDGNDFAGEEVTGELVGFDDRWLILRTVQGGVSVTGKPSGLARLLARNAEPQKSTVGIHEFRIRRDLLRIEEHHVLRRQNRVPAAPTKNYQLQLIRGEEKSVRGQLITVDQQCIELETPKGRATFALDDVLYIRSIGVLTCDKPIWFAHRSHMDFTTKGTLTPKE